MLKNYLKIALKVFGRRKFFTAISLFGISFTLLVLTVVTALIDHAMAPTAPETRMPQTLTLSRTIMYGPNSTWGGDAGYRLIDRYARKLPGVDLLSIMTRAESVNSYVRGVALTSTRKGTDGGFWTIMRFTFLEGAPYTQADVDAARFVAVINAATRDRFFDGQPAVGKTLEADGQRFQVVGVVDNVSRMRTQSSADLYVPYTTAKTDAYKREFLGDFNAVALLHPGADPLQVTAEFNSRLRAFDFSEVPNGQDYKSVVAPFETLFDSYARQLPWADGKNPESQGWQLRLLLAGSALLFMLLPAMNLMNLNMSRILERSSEIGVRKAFGASSHTLVVQFVVENLLLTIIGGLIGFVFSQIVLAAITASGVIEYAHFALNYRVFAYGLGLAVAFSLLSGVYPAWRMSRMHPVQALKGGSR
jgi:putative ABC transport system permease protein